MGEPGVGKTRLAAQFAAEVHAAGATVLYGRCDEEPLLAYQPFVEALRHYLRFGDWESDAGSEPDLRQLSRLLPEARPPDGAPAESFPKDAGSERYLLFAAVARLIDRADASRPLLIVLDDLHWADKPTLLLLRHMLRLTDPARLMLLGIFRDVEVDPDHPFVELIADMRRERRFDRLALEGLDERETDELVAARLDATGQRRLRARPALADRGQPVLHRGGAALARAVARRRDGHRGRRGRARRDGRSRQRRRRHPAPPRRPRARDAGRAARGGGRRARVRPEDRRGAARRPRRRRPRRDRRGDGGGPRRRGRRRLRPLHVLPRARARRDLRPRLAQPAAAPAPARRRGARGGAHGAGGRRRRRARPPLLHGARARRRRARPCATASSPASSAARVAGLRGVGRALPPRAGGVRARPRAATSARAATSCWRWGACSGRPARRPPATRTSRRPTARAPAATPSSSRRPRSGSASATGRPAPSTSRTRSCWARRSTRSATRTAGRARG